MGDARVHRRWPDGRAVDSSAMPPLPRWRDVVAAYLVHRGLRLASLPARAEIRAVLAQEWCARQRLARDTGTPAEGG